VALSSFSPPAQWTGASLCSQVDPEVWFPELGGSVKSAKRICNRCPVRPQCLDQALERDEEFGVWGGMSPRDRRSLKRRVGTTY